MIKNNYYKWSKALSFNALFHIIISERGLGKTYGFLIFLLKSAYYNNKKAIILTKFINELAGKNNYATETFETMLSILNDIDDFKGLEIELKLIKNHVYMNDKIVFSFYAINNAEKMKKITTLKTYHYIVHDEFLTLGTYCRFEVSKFLTIYDTVDRRRNITKAFLLGNSLTKFNPYMEELGLPNDVQGYRYLKDRKFLIHVSNNVEYQKERLQSAITKLAGTDSKYLQMANKTEFVYDNDDYVIDIPKKDLGDHRFSLMINEKVYTISMCDQGFYIHELAKMDKRFHNKRPSIYSRMISIKLLKQLRELYYASMIYYANIDIKMNFIKEYIKE